MEILRRALLLAGLLAAVWCFLRPTPALVGIAGVDFVQDHKRRPKWEAAAKATLEEFVAARTKDRLVEVDGPRWDELADAADKLAAGERPAAATVRRAGHGYNDKTLYFYPGEPPVAEVVTRVSGLGNFAYLRLKGRDAYLTAIVSHPHDTIRSAPASMMHPLRRYSPWLVLAALAAYVLLPWPEATPESLRYSRLRAGVLPDLIGAMLGVVFFALPLLIVPRNSSSGELLDSEWISLTLVLWAFVAFSFAIMAAAAWYTSLRIDLLEAGFRRVTLFGKHEIRYADIKESRIVSVEAPRWLVGLGLTVSLLNWRAASPTLLAAGRRAAALELTMADGRKVRILLDSLPYAERLLEVLNQQGIPGECSA